FYNAGNPALYLASADLMERNLFRRVEVAFPIESASLRRRILRALALYLRDNRQAWVLGSDGSYRAVHPRGRTTRRAQQELLRHLAVEGGKTGHDRSASETPVSSRDRPRSGDLHRIGGM
ncbi:MAG: hypothetical protein ACRD3Y_11335, partial [Bryobacteraceae bacterium]